MNAALASRKQETTLDGTWDHTVATSRMGSALPQDMLWADAYAYEGTQADKHSIIVNRIFSPGGVLDLGLPKDFEASMRAARAHFGC